MAKVKYIVPNSLYLKLYKEEFMRLAKEKPALIKALVEEYKKKGDAIFTEAKKKKEILMDKDKDEKNAEKKDETPEVKSVGMSNKHDDKIENRKIAYFNDRIARLAMKIKKNDIALEPMADIFEKAFAAVEDDGVVTQEALDKFVKAFNNIADKKYVKGKK